MKQSQIYAAVFGAGFAFAASVSAAAAADPSGIWLDDTGRGAVEIKSCGSGVCGYVVAVKNANDTKGCGKQIIGDAKPAGGGLWGNGWIYSPEKRKNYDVELKPLSNGTLRVVGYAGTKLFSRTMIWTPAPADIKRCDVKEPLAPAANEASVEKPAAQPKPVAAIPAANAKTEQPKAEVVKPAANTLPADEPAEEVAEATPEADVDTDGGEQPGKRSGGGLKIGNLDLEKVLSRSASGKCKLDLPWVKVQFDCERE